MNVGRLSSRRIASSRRLAARARECAWNPGIVDSTAGTPSFGMADGRGPASAPSNPVARMRLWVRANLDLHSVRGLPGS